MKVHSKNIVILFMILFTITSAKSDYKSNELLYINRANKLKLLSVDDKCGEWGGDKKTITIYRDDFKGQLLADYVEEIKDCNSDNKDKIGKAKKRIVLNQQEKDLIVNCLRELVSNKLNRDDIPSHSGLFNQALLSDSSINIQDFSEKKWETFNVLAAKLKAK